MFRETNRIQNECYKNTREFVLSAIAIRNELQTDRIPSDYWTDFANNFRYVYDLNPTELIRIRYHTYHLTSDSYLTYYFAADGYKCLLEDGYCYFSKGYNLLSLDEGEFGIGIDTKYGRISHDLLRYLGVYCDIKGAGITAGKANKIVMELGGGYGGLARVHLTQLASSSYIICDLEETLFFSAVYLSNCFGDDRVHFVDSMLLKDSLQPGNVYLVPQSQINLLENLYFDYVISQQSLQEMTRDQVNFYLEWISKRAGYLYSCNINSHGRLAAEKSIVTNLHVALIDRLGDPIWRGAIPNDDFRYGDNHLPRSMFRVGPE